MTKWYRVRSFPPPILLIKKVEFKHLVGEPVHYSRFKPKCALACGGVLEI